MWKDRNINLATKMKLYNHDNACVIFTLMYARECWTLTQRDWAKLELYGLRILTRSKIKQPQLTAVIRKRRLRWFDHLKEWTFTVSPRSCTTENHPAENEDLAEPGRPTWPKTSWRDVIQKDISKLDMGWIVNKAEVAARERIYVETSLCQAANVSK